MKVSEHALDKQLVLQLDNLQLERQKTESSCMFGGKDEADTVCASLRTKHERTKAQADKTLGSGGKDIVHGIKKRIPGRTNQYVQKKEVLLGVAARLKGQYELSTRIRSSFETISRVAYMTEPPVITDAYSQIRQSKWKMVYHSDRQLFSKCEHHHGMSYDTIKSCSMNGGRKGSLFAGCQNQVATFFFPSPNESDLNLVGQEWKDIQALCSAMILLFEHLISPELSRNPALGQDVKKLLNQSQSLGNNFYQLLSYPEYFSPTSELLGSAAAMAHVAIKCVETIRTSISNQYEDPCDGGKSLGYYGRQLKNLCAIVDELLSKSSLILHEASKPEPNVVVLQNVQGLGLQRSSHTMHTEANEDQVMKAEKHLESCKYFDVKDLKLFGLPEVLLSPGEGHQIGFGSSSVVFEHRVLEGMTRYAVKEPSGATANNRDSLWNKFGREAQVWRLLKHENILPLRGFCLLSNDLPGLVMDVHRWNLKDFVRECSPSSKQRLELLHGASEGISYLHSQNIAHGDLRACNILVKENSLRTGFSALLTDFGTAYFVNGAADPVTKETKFKATHDQVGNVGWLSPELLRNVASQDEEDAYPYVSIPGDAYSFGCVFLEVIFEREPYQECSSDEVKKDKILQGLLPASLEETSGIYYEFLRSLWDPIPDRRPSAEQAAGWILNFLQNHTL
ncbi:hypothetical protein ACEPAF_126 [Sanghuangporus sanghuang]